MASAKREILPIEELSCAESPMLFNPTSQYIQNNTGRRTNAKDTSFIRNNLDFYYSPAHLNADCWAQQNNPNETQPFSPLYESAGWMDRPLLRV